MADKGPFAEMTEEQLEYWLHEIRPVLIHMQEQSERRARQAAFDLIRRPLRERPTSSETVRRHITNEV